MNNTVATAVEAAGQGSVYRLPLPFLRRPYTAIRRQALGFRRAFESVLLRERGGVSEWQAKVLRTAAKAYSAALRCDRILASAGAPGESMTHGEYQGWLDRSVRYEADCDRALRSIGLDRRADADPWDAFYRGSLTANPIAEAAPSAALADSRREETLPDAPDAPQANGARLNPVDQNVNTVSPMSDMKTLANGCKPDPPTKES